MAKSKRSAALFEVIQSSRMPKRESPLFTPQKWFRRFAKPAPFFTAPAASGAPPVDLSVVTCHATADDREADTTLDLLTAPVEPPSHPRQPIPGVDLQLDPDRHQITFKISYNSAIITAFSVLMAIGLAFVVGKKTSHGPIAATASPSSAELRSQPAHPEVLDVAGTVDTKPTELLTSTTGDSAQLAAAGTSAAPTTAPSPFDAQRIIGRDYVIVQIYPSKKDAQDAATLLDKNNLPCTVENGVTGWASKSWWCVVGTTGFDHIRGNADYARYETAINRVSDQFAANSKFKKFEPRAYRWKESAT
jgi:hypothetical protein